MKFIRKLGIGLGIVAGLVYSRPARGLDILQPLLPISETQGNFDYFAPLTISLSDYSLGGYFGKNIANTESEDGFILELTPIQTTKYGLPVLGRIHEVLKGRFSLSPDTQLTTQFSFNLGNREQPSIVEMLKTRLELSDPQEFFSGFGSAERTIDEIILGLKTGRNYFELRKGVNSRSFRANFKDDISLGFSERGTTKTLEGTIGHLRLTTASSPNSSNYTLDYTSKDYTVHLMRGTNGERFIIQRGGSLLNYGDINGVKNIILKHDNYSIFINPDKKIYLFTPKDWNLKIVDAAYGIDIDLQKEKWKFEHLESAGRNFIQYFLNKNFALGLQAGENGIEPYKILWRKDLGNLNFDGFGLGRASLDFEFNNSYIPNIGLNIGSPGSPFFLRYNSGTKALLLNWKDPKSRHNEVYLDLTGKEKVGWASYRKEF